MTSALLALPANAEAVLESAVGSLSPKAAAQFTSALSARYRSGATSESGGIIGSNEELLAYAAFRFPATYAAAAAAFQECAKAAPDWRPTSALDVGTGSGATVCAALHVWPSLREITCLDQDSRVVELGRQMILAFSSAAGITWLPADMRHSLPDEQFQLVTGGYALSELAADDPVDVAVQLWPRTTNLLVLVEPGRPSAYELLMRIRDTVIGHGAHVLAPCPHSDACPLLGSDWCHFGQRLPRTQLHRASKGGELSYEDEKFSYVALARRPPATSMSRVVRRPARRKGLVVLELCRRDGVAKVSVPKAAGQAYRDAKDVLWGQTFDSS